MDKLYSHQEDAIQFAIHNGGKCAIFHEPGLGKTRTALEIYRCFKRNNPKLKLFVVCPLSLVHFAWGEDIHKFTNFTYAPFKEIKDKLPDIVVINYEGLISKKYLPQIMRMIIQHDFMCVADESSRAKNSKSVTTKTLLRLAEYFKYRIIASGTPMPNSELELWGQINFIQPFILHSSFYAFRNIYFHLERNGRVMEMSGQHMSREAMRDILSRGWKYTITPEKRKKLMDEIKPLSHWVRKEEALDLPEKIDQVREVVLNVKERKAYNEMKHDLIVEIRGKEITAQVTLAKLMKLRQAISGFFYDEDGKVLEIGYSSKLKELMCVVEELGKQSMIIWGNFRHEIRVIEKQLKDKYGYGSVVTAYSQTKDLDNSINKFKSKKSQFLIANPQSIGHGVTLTNCSTQIFYSLSYSYEQYTQARDRIHRISQKKSCLYIHLIAKGTIDEEILAIVQRKKTVQEAVYQIINEI